MDHLVHELSRGLQINCKFNIIGPKSLQRCVERCLTFVQLVVHLIGLSLSNHFTLKCVVNLVYCIAIISKF